MTTTIKAPDLGVVKSLAKSIRKNLPETAKISHAKALEIASNSFGFSSWHACRLHFDYLSAGVFSPPEEGDLTKFMGDFPISANCFRVLLKEHRSFSSGKVTVKGGFSSGRSKVSFLFPIIELGARMIGDHDGMHVEPFKGSRFMASLKRQVNTGNALHVWNKANRSWFLQGFALFGSAELNNIIMIRNGRLPDFLRAGLSAIRVERESGVVDLQRLCCDLRASDVYPNGGLTFAVDFEIIQGITRLCQIKVNEDSDGLADQAKSPSQSSG